MENDIKIKSHKVEEKECEVAKLKNINSELSYKNIILQNEIKANKIGYDSQRNELQKEVEKLIKNNEIFKKENTDLSEQLKVFLQFKIRKCKIIRISRKFPKIV